jgi:hypothetical protein
MTGRATWLSRLPRLLITLHALLMVFVALVWIHETREMGTALVGPDANFWYRVVQVESFPASWLVRLGMEIGIAKIAFGLRLSFNEVIVGYWFLLLALGALQWYLIGVLLLKVRARLGRNSTR